MGKTWHLNHDQAVYIDREADSFFWTNDNGNELEIPYLEPNDEAVIVSEKIRYRHDPGRVLIEDYENALFTTMPKFAPRKTATV